MFIVVNLDVILCALHELTPQVGQPTADTNVIQKDA